MEGYETELERQLDKTTEGLSEIVEYFRNIMEVRDAEISEKLDEMEDRIEALERKID